MTLSSCEVCESVKVAALYASENPQFLQCSDCEFSFKGPAHWLSPEEEEKRYRTHNNDVHDPGYQNFSRPLTNWILELTEPSNRLLDFGCGPGPVIPYLLRQKGYDRVDLYDPFFGPKELPHEPTYPLIFMCEVIEHLKRPHKELARLKTLLKPGGSLLIQTLFWQGQDLRSWHYAKDPTHIGFFNEKSLTVLSARLGFHTVEYRGDRLARFF